MVFHAVLPPHPSDAKTTSSFEELSGTCYTFMLNTSPSSVTEVDTKYNNVGMKTFQKYIYITLDPNPFRNDFRWLSVLFLSWIDDQDNQLHQNTHVWINSPIYLIGGLQNQIHLNILSNCFIYRFFAALHTYLVSNKTQTPIKNTDPTLMKLKCK